MDGRVSVLETSGRARVLRDDIPSANGITVHQGRLFIGECREGGRLLELDLNGGEPTGAGGQHADRRTPWRSVPTGCCISR